MLVGSKLYHLSIFFLSYFPVLSNGDSRWGLRKIFSWCQESVGLWRITTPLLDPTRSLRISSSLELTLPEPIMLAQAMWFSCCLHKIISFYSTSIPGLDNLDCFSLTNIGGICNNILVWIDGVVAYVELREKEGLYSGLKTKIMTSVDIAWCTANYVF